MGIAALRLYCLGAIFGGYSSITASYCLSVGAESHAALINALRSILVPLPLCIAFAALAPGGFWGAFPASEIICVLIWRVVLAARFKERTSEDACDPKRIFNRTITGNIENIGVLSESVESFCDEWGADQKRKFHVMIVVEEITAVIIGHAFRKDAVEYINISIIAAEDGGFHIHVRDNADFFDPFSMEARRVRTESEGNLDGLGVFMVKSFAQKFFYRRYRGFNTLVIYV
jgi:anti-sigma regulatory factor (Ser/Thr protein kinase)